MLRERETFLQVFLGRQGGSALLLLLEAETMEELSFLYFLMGLFAVILTYLTVRDLCNKDGGLESYHKKWL